MTTQPLSHDDVDELLPWFANDTLDQFERAGVSQHLEQCTECRDSLAVLIQMRDSVNDHRAIPMVPEPRLDDLLDRVDQVERAAPARIAARTWMIAASVAILAFAALILLQNRLEDPAGPEFRTATSPGQTASVGYVMNLTFAAGTAELTRDSVLSDLDATVLSETTTGIVQVVIPLQAASMTVLEGFTSELLSKPEFDAVEVVAVQLPVQQEE